jgi:hypothetical protein
MNHNFSKRGNTKNATSILLPLLLMGLVAGVAAEPHTARAAGGTGFCTWDTQGEWDMNSA